jgi:CBS domain-containing protein
VLVRRLGIRRPARDHHDVPQRFELRHLELECRRELPIPGGVGDDPLGIRETVLDLRERLLPTFEPRAPGGRRLEAGARRRDGVGVRFLLSRKRGPESAERRVVARCRRVRAIERARPLLQPSAPLENRIELHHGGDHARWLPRRSPRISQGVSGRCEPRPPCPSQGRETPQPSRDDEVAWTVLERVAMANSCDELRREHRLITRVVAGLDALSLRRLGGVDVPTLPVTGAVEFFAEFVARCHEVKEDEALFPVLVARGGGNGLIAALRHDHEEGEQLLRALRPFTSRQRAGGEAWGLLERYLDVLRRHVASEDVDLLPLADRVLSPEDDASLERAFRAIEERALGRPGTEAIVALGVAVGEAADAIAAESPPRGAGLVARDVMRATPGTVGPDDSLARAVEVMESFRSREVPVVSGRALVGILTRTDLEPHRGHFEWTAVRAAMTADPVSVGSETPVPVVAGLLLGRGFNALPVTDAGELVGMIARSDVLRVFAENA